MSETIVGIPSSWQIPLVVVTSLLGFLFILALSEYSVWVNSTCSSSKQEPADISALKVPTIFKDEVKVEKDSIPSPTSVLQMGPSTPEKKRLVPSDAEGTVFTPAGRRSARIANRSKNE